MIVIMILIIIITIIFSQKNDQVHHHRVHLVYQFNLLKQIIQQQPIEIQINIQVLNHYNIHIKMNNIRNYPLKQLHFNLVSNRCEMMNQVFYSHFFFLCLIYEIVLFRINLYDTTRIQSSS
jgi:hypothetical protein